MNGASPYDSDLEVIALGNHKGGVAKTTSAVQVAAALTRSGFRVLLVDADPQAQATLYLYQRTETPEYDLQDVTIHRMAIAEAITSTRHERLDLLPATLALAELDMDLVTATKREETVSRAFRQVQDRYDFIIVDLPPALSMTVNVCLAAATRIVVPVDLTLFAAQSLGSFLSWTERYRQLDVISASLLGVLATMVDLRRKIDREVLSTLRFYQAERGLPLFETMLPERTGIEQQVAGRLVVGERGMNPDVDRAYGEVTGEILARLGKVPAYA